MQVAEKYLNKNIADILALTAKLPNNMFCNNDYNPENGIDYPNFQDKDRKYDLSKKQLISILNQVSQGTPIDLAFRAEGLSSLFMRLSKLSANFQHYADDYMLELTVYRLIERVWFKGLSSITNNIYRMATDCENNNAISAAKLLLDYHDKMEKKIKEYDAIMNIGKRK